MSILNEAFLDNLKGVLNYRKDGFDVNYTNNEGRPPLMVAANSNLPDLVELLISEGANVDVCDENELTVLHHAAREGWLSIARSAVERGINVNVTTKRGRTPLILAAEHGNLDIAKLLVSAGANVNYCHVSNNVNAIISVLNHVFILEQPEESEMEVNDSCESDKGRTALLAAVERGNTEIVKFLIGAGANVNCRSCARLHIASQTGHLETAQVLVENRANLNVRINSGYTPLYMACGSLCKEMVECLVNAGVDLNAEVKGESPLTYLIKRFDDVDLFKLFIKRGANLTSKEYELMLEKPFLKESILQDAKVCSEIIIDNFNNKDLSKFYELADYACSLPKFDKMKITAGSKVSEEVMKSVEHNIQANGHCNILEVRPIVLSMFSVRSFIDCYRNVQKSRSNDALMVTQAAEFLRESPVLDSDNEPCCSKENAKIEMEGQLD